jgi:crotonobetainyl-CoA:carnitine CoA-transferase CaiB-like acyl-CoA transferase
VVAQPLKMSRTPPAVTMAAPDAGEHSDAVLRELGMSDDEIAGLRARSII